MYITLQQASDHLAAKRLPGQTVRVLRAAIARRRLAAIKDGRVWRTTVEKLDDYECSLWRQPEPPTSLPATEPKQGRPFQAPQQWHRSEPQRDAAAMAQLKAMFGTAMPSEAQLEALLGRNERGLTGGADRSPAALLSAIEALISLR